MPINSTFALAQITSVEITGNSEVEGIVSDYDSVSITAFFDSQPDDAKLDFYGMRDFDECSDAVCNYTSETRQLSHGDKVEVFEYSEDSIIDSKEVSMRVDDEPPEITELEIEREGDVYEFLIGMKDYPDFCSGIGSVNILAGQDIKETFEVEESFCSLEEEYELSSEELSLDRGYNEICVELYDNVGFLSEEKCESVFFDDREPELNDFRLLDMDGNEIEYISEHASIEAQVRVNVTDLQLNKVIGNFSDFHNNYDYEGMQAQCEETGEENYLCIWEGLELRSDSGELGYEVTAEDKQGNKATETSSFSLTYDDSPPAVEDIYTSPKIGDTEDLYVTSGKNKIYVEFSDQASGFVNKNVYADIQAFGQNFDNRQADECIRKEGKWRCFFEIDFEGDSSGDGFFSLSSSTEDDAGNHFGEDVERELIVDNEEPVVIEANTPDDICPHAGSGLDIELIAESKSPIKVNTTAGVITRVDEEFEAECGVEEGNEYKCELHIDELVRTHTKDSIDINVIDAAGNKHVEEVDVEVCEAIEGESPDLVDVDYSTNTQIDRRTLSYVSLPVPINLELRPREQSEIVGMDADCQSPVESSHITNKNSLSPLVIARVGEAAVENGDGPVEFNCTLGLLLKQSGKFYTQPQTEELNIKLEATPGFGEMGESVEEKIEGIEDDIDDIDDKIDSWEQWNQWLSKICSLAETLASMNSAMALLKSVVYGISAGMTSVCPGGYPPLKAVCNAGWTLWSFVCKLASKYNKYITEWVWNPSWKSGYSSGTGQWIKWLCFIYSCKLCTWDYAESTADITGVDSKIVRSVGGFASVYQSLGSGGFTSGVAESVVGESVADSPYFHASAGAVVGASKLWASDRQEPSRIGLILDGAVMDPYKSIHSARACLCIPGIIYNLQKDKQIKCMYRNCLQERAEAGLPTDFCDKVYRERQCLYVDGAQWKAIGSNAVFDFFQNIVGLIIRNLPAIRAAESWSSKCESIGDTPGVSHVTGGVTEGISGFTGGCDKRNGPLLSYQLPYKNVLCHVTGAALQLMQVGSFMDVDFDKYDAGLEGDTVC
ncbi:MAG: hypothetical protein ACOCQG_00975 [Candidatus Nanoarchaeia archaeon]